MFKKLRYQFIAIAMGSMAAVLILMIGGINLANYIHVDRATDLRLDILSDNGGRFPRPDRLPNTPGMRDLSAELPFETRFFTVALRSDDGTVVSIDTGKIAAVTTREAADYAGSLWLSHRLEGYLDDYKYRAVSFADSAGEEQTLYIFLDCRRELSSFRSFLFISVSASLLGMLSVFLLVVFFSRRLVRPMAESYAKQKRFITDARHELKTPLTIIDANTEVLEMTTGENEWTVSIHHQIERLSSLIQKLIFLSRMEESGAQTMTMLDFSLSDAVEETARPFEAVAAAQGKTLTLEIAPEISCHGDEASLRQLVSLLLDNAVKYSSEKGSIRLTLQTNGKSRVLTVWNTAEGLAPGRQDLLFERFYRADGSRNSSTGGYGIGLSVAQAIVSAHRGKITAKSADGQSILFTVTLYS